VRGPLPHHAIAQPWIGRLQLLCDHHIIRPVGGADESEDGKRRRGCVDDPM